VVLSSLLLKMTLRLMVGNKRILWKRSSIHSALGLLPQGLQSVTIKALNQLQAVRGLQDLSRDLA
jgi:hypothetical protein